MDCSDSKHFDPAETRFCEASAKLSATKDIMPIMYYTSECSIIQSTFVNYAHNF